MEIFDFLCSIEEFNKYKESICREIAFRNYSSTFKLPQQEKIILGIDPGTNIMGYGVISVTGSHVKLIALGIISMEKMDDHYLKLRTIFEKTTTLIDSYHPDELAIEAPFFGKNVQSMLKLGRAQGVAMAAGLARSIPIFEYSPKKIKQSITGKGNASKEQVASMLQTLLGYKETPQYLDATDGLAAALCHYFQGKAGSAGSPKKGGSWKAFLEANPERIRQK